MLFTEMNPPSTSQQLLAESPQQLLERIAEERSHISSLFLFSSLGKLVAAAAKPLTRDQHWQNIAHEVWQTTQRTCQHQAESDLKFIALQCAFGQVAASALANGHMLAIIGKHEVRLGVLLYEVDGLAAMLSPMLP